MFLRGGEDLFMIAIIFFVIGACILLSLLLLLPSIFERKVTTLLVLFSVLISMIAYLISLHYHWAMSVGFLIVLIFLGSYILATRMLMFQEHQLEQHHNDLSPTEEKLVEQNGQERTFKMTVAEDVSKNNQVKINGNNQMETDDLIESLSIGGQHRMEDESQFKETPFQEKLTGEYSLNYKRHTVEKGVHHEPKQDSLVNTFERKPLNEENNEPALRKKVDSNSVEELLLQEEEHQQQTDKKASYNQLNARRKKLFN